MFIFWQESTRQTGDEVWDTMSARKSDSVSKKWKGFKHTRRLTQRWIRRWFRLWYHFTTPHCWQFAADRRLFKVDNVSSKLEFTTRIFLARTTPTSVLVNPPHHPPPCHHSLCLPVQSLPAAAPPLPSRPAWDYAKWCGSHAQQGCQRR